MTSSLTLVALVALVLAFKGAVWDVVQPDDRFHWVLDDEVLSVLLLAHNINNAAHDAPCVVHGEVDLSAELGWLELLRPEDDVAGRVLHLVPGYVPVEGEWKVMNDFI